MVLLCFVYLFRLLPIRNLAGLCAKKNNFRVVGKSLDTTFRHKQDIGRSTNNVKANLNLGSRWGQTSQSWRGRRSKGVTDAQWRQRGLVCRKCLCNQQRSQIPHIRLCFGSCPQVGPAKRTHSLGRKKRTKYFLSLSFACPPYISSFFSPLSCTDRSCLNGKTSWRAGGAALHCKPDCGCFTYLNPYLLLYWCKPRLGTSEGNTGEGLCVCENDSCSILLNRGCTATGAHGQHRRHWSDFQIFVSFCLNNLLVFVYVCFLRKLWFRIQEIKWEINSTIIVAKGEPKNRFF